MALHGSPRDRGESDAYYGRAYRPHKWTTGIGGEVLLTEPAEVAAYAAGYNGEPERKDFGRPIPRINRDELAAV